MHANWGRVKVTEQEDLVVLTVQGEEVARHQVAQGHHQRCVQPLHYQGLPASTRRRGRPSARQVLPEVTALQPFWDAPRVEVRSLSVYDQML